MTRRNTIREFALRRLAEGAKPMAVWREAQEKFGHCGWGYICALARSRNASDPMEEEAGA